MASYIEPRQPLVAQSRHGIAQDGDAEEDEEDLVRLAGKDADAGLGLEDIDACDEEEGRAEVDGEGDGDVAHDVCPTADPARDAAPFGGREHEGLVVDTCTRGTINTSKTRDRGGGK